MTRKSPLSQSSIDRQASYWEEQLDGDLPPLGLITDFPRPPVPSFRRGAVSFELHGAELRALGVLCEQERSTFFAGLLGAYALLLSRHASQHHIRVGTPCTGRVREASGDERTFANIVAIDTRVSDDLTVRELLHRVTATVTEAAANGDYPFESLADAAGGYNRPPIVHTMFVSNGVAGELCAESDSRPRAVSDFGLHAARCGVTWTITRVRDGVTVTADYDADLFEERSIRRMLEHYGVLVAAMGHAPDAGVVALPLLTAVEHEEMLLRWNDTTIDVPTDTCVHELIEAQVARTPDAVALIARGESLSHRELNERANRLAHYLIVRGVGPEALVGIALERSVDLVVTVLAVLKAGSAYVPLDPAYPARRVADMLDDARVAVVVTRSDIAIELPMSGVSTVVRLDQEKAAIDMERGENPDRRSAPENLAYVIYTSGSTGRPKGVMVEHRNVVNFCAAMDARIGTQPGVWLAVTSLSFDISVLELIWTLTHGYTVVVHVPPSGTPRSSSATALPSPALVAAPPMQFGLFYFASDEGEHARESGRTKYRLLLEGAKYADEHGFSAVWTPERHFHTFGGLYPNPALTSAAIAVITEHVHIRAGSCVLPLNDPVRVTEAWSLVDNLSNGRVGVSFASGWQPEDFVFAPQTYRERHDVMFREIETVCELWRGGTLSKPGGHGKDVTFGTRPRPVQRELPVWVTAGGTPSTFRRAGEIGANLLTHLLGQSIEELAEKIHLYRDAWRASGHEGEGHVTLMLHTFVGEDEEQVRATVKGPLTQYLRGSVSLFTPFAAALGLDMKNLSEADIDALAEHAFTRYYETSGLFGTPEQCLAIVKRLRALGVDELACLIDFGIPSQTVLEALPYLNAVREMASAVAEQAETTNAAETRPSGDASANDAATIPALIQRHGVTHLQCTPSLAEMLVADADAEDALRGLTHLFVGGEAFPAPLAARLRALVPNGRVMNMYGPTETTIWSATYELPRSDSCALHSSVWSGRGSDQGSSAGPVPIGRPIANTELYVLNASRQPVPVGVTGELYIGGRGVVRGYLRRPELTAERFVEHPFRSEPGERLYRTGDLVRYRADGVVEFVGRVDQQVKLRGHRIELGEIEAALREHAAVRNAAVVVREDVPGNPRLVAYLMNGTGGSLVVDEVRTSLRARLPEVMVPAAWVVLDSLPLTPNGKIDRRALPTPAESGDDAATSYVAPANAVEEAIAAVWCEVLKRDRIGMLENFFDLGGHSILVIHVVNRLRDALGRELMMTDMFMYPTIRGLAEFVGAGETGTAV